MADFRRRKHDRTKLSIYLNDKEKASAMAVARRFGRNSVAAGLRLAVEAEQHRHEEKDVAKEMARELNELSGKLENLLGVSDDSHGT